MGSCFGKRSKELLKKIFVVLLYQVIGWILYTYIEEGFALTDCLFDQDNIRRLKTTNTAQGKAKLYNDLNRTMGGDLNGTIFNIYHEEFKTYFAAKEPNSDSIDVNEICKRWYLFTAITLTTVGYGNVVPKTVAGKLVFFPYCLVGIPIMLFFLGYIGKLITELSYKIVEFLHCRRNGGGQMQISHKELKSFLVTFTLLWLHIIFEAIISHYAINEKDRLTMIDGIYFFFVSFTTIGYGDITSPMKQALFEFRLYIGLSLMSGVVNSALEYYQAFSQRRNEQNRGRKGCCCKVGHTGSGAIEPVEEMVEVKATYTQEEQDISTAEHIAITRA